MGPPLELLLIPPPISPADDEGSPPPPESILLDPYGYISDRRNGSTAEGSTRDHRRIWVTFWATLPPRVSCFTVNLPALPQRSVPSAFGGLPKVLNTDGDLALLRLAILPDAGGDGDGGEVDVDHNSNEYFVYQAGGLKKKRPSLHRIAIPRFLEFSDRDAVLLRRRRGMFFVAVLCRRRSDRERLDVHLYSSKTGNWITKKMSSSQEQFDYSYTSKAITIGEELGSVGWVDLWHGILVYDVLLDTNYFRYIPLPSPVAPVRLKSNPMLARDIIVVNGYIKFFDMHTYMKLVDNGYTYIPDGWDAATWKLNISKKDSKWEDDCKIKISEVPLKGNEYAQMLPNPTNNAQVLTDLNEGGGTQPSLTRLYACYPALSLHDDGVVHIMNRREPHDNMAWMVAVDMRNQNIKGVGFFGSGRPVGYGFTFLETGISKHLGIRYSR